MIKWGRFKFVKGEGKGDGSDGNDRGGKGGKGGGKFVVERFVE